MRSIYYRSVRWGGGLKSENRAIFSHIVCCADSATATSHQ